MLTESKPSECAQIVAIQRMHGFRQRFSLGDLSRRSAGRVVFYYEPVMAEADRNAVAIDCGMMQKPK